MSVEMWPDPNNPKIEYPIGTIGCEPYPIKVNGIFGTLINVVRATYNNIIGIGDILIPTYGFWGGPGWRKKHKIKKYLRCLIEGGLYESCLSRRL